MSLIIFKRKSNRKILSRIKARFRKNKDIHIFNNFFKFLRGSTVSSRKLIWWIEDYVEAEKNNDEDYSILNIMNIMNIMNQLTKHLGFVVSSCQFMDQKKMKEYCQWFSVAN